MKVVKKSIEIFFLAATLMLFGCTIDVSSDKTDNPSEKETEVTTQTKENIIKKEDTEKEIVEEPVKEEAKDEEKSFISIPQDQTLEYAANGGHYLYGSTSDNCSRIDVLAVNEEANIYDPYTLEKYEYGDTSFRYGIKKEWDNLGDGTNKYTFTAFCDGEKEVQAEFEYILPIEIEVELPMTTIETPSSNTYSSTSTNCHPSYSGCLDANASDYDCKGGSGNGPYYTGKVRVIGPDVFDLDRDNDGWGCE